MTNEVRSGQCLCGAVQFRFQLSNDGIQACHCKQCQRWTGGSPLFSVRVDDLTIDGEGKLGRYHASTHGERAFCSICGTTLFWRMQGQPVNFVQVGLLDDQAGLTVTSEIFVDQRADWMPPWHGATQSTEAEELARLDDFLAKQEVTDS